MSPGTKTFYHEEWNFSVTYPADWEIIYQDEPAGSWTIPIAVAGAEERYRDIPDKNNASHPADAEQYLALGFAGGYVNDSYHSQEEAEEDEDYGQDETTGY